MAKIYVYNNNKDKIEVYSKSENDVMPYVTGSPNICFVHVRSFGKHRDRPIDLLNQRTCPCALFVTLK